MIKRSKQNYDDATKFKKEKRSLEFFFKNMQQYGKMENWKLNCEFDN